MATKTTRCLCSSFEFGVFDVETDEDYGTDCTQSTTKVFAQGHDAKLVGFLVRAELAGQEIRRGSVHFAGAVQAASSISSALAAKTQAQLDAAKARLAKKASKPLRGEVRIAKKAEAPAPTKREATIKIGRWTYDATIDPNGFALYNTKKGECKSAKPGEYTEI